MFLIALFVLAAYAIVLFVAPGAMDGRLFAEPGR